MIEVVRFDGTNLLVFCGILLVVAAGSWQFVGAFLVWVLWQVVLFYLVLIAVALVLYGALFVAVGGGAGSSSPGRKRDGSGETGVE